MHGTEREKYRCEGEISIDGCFSGLEAYVRFLNDGYLDGSMAGTIEIRFERAESLPTVSSGDGLKIRPFCKEMVMNWLCEPEKGIFYDLAGTRIGEWGHPAYGKEGNYKSWDIRRVLINNYYFRNGVLLRIEGETEEGCSGAVSFPDEFSLILPGFQFAVSVFLPLEKLQDILGSTDHLYGHFRKALARFDLPDYHGKVPD